jgi:uncharacterized RDD family membrane protein YckC
VADNCPGAEQANSAEYSAMPDEKNLVPADMGRRITAAFIDACVAGFIFFFAGWLCTFRIFGFLYMIRLFWILPIVYILVRDMYIQGKPVSFGKKIAGLDVITTRGGNPDFVGSLQRNILFFFPPLTLCMAGLELYLIIRTKDHKRFGDHFGKTTVVERGT